MEQKVARSIALVTEWPEVHPHRKGWVYGEIRKALSSADIISGQSHTKLLKHVEFIRVPEEADLVREWFSSQGGKFDSVVIYLRPSGKGMAAVKAAKIPCKISNVVEYPSPSWSEEPDVTDCLADFNNLQILQMNLRNVSLGRYLTKQVGMDKKEPPGFRTQRESDTKEGRF